MNPTQDLRLVTAIHSAFGGLPIPVGNPSGVDPEERPANYLPRQFDRQAEFAIQAAARLSGETLTADSETLEEPGGYEQTLTMTFTRKITHAEFAEWEELHRWLGITLANTFSKVE